jgi:signal transduction histidine kinase/ActR/RegA family two-component response regulator
MLQGQYEPSLVVVSMLVAVLASYTALALAGRLSDAQPSVRAWWMGGGAFAMGTGIWAMHFIGMLAFRLPIPLGYDFGITLLSWLLPVVASAGALWLFSLPTVTPAILAGSAVLLGLGINAMHYLGMAALRMSPHIAWDWLLVALSIAIAIGAAGASLWIARRLRRPGPRVLQYRAGAAVAMGAAIVGMHYTGMAAAGFPAGSICGAAAGSSFTPTQLALLVITGTVSVLGIALLTAVFDGRLEARSQLLAASQRAADERRRLLDLERSARAEAERLSDVKDQFLATLSHELRTPLNAILGWVQILRRKSDAESVERGLETIERNARLQATLIEDLLDMSRIVSGNVRVEKQPVRIVAVLDAALEAVRPTALAKRIEMHAHVETEADEVCGDPARLQQVIWNLLTNALKFTPEGGTVHVRVRREGGNVVTAVSDNGGGIDPAFLPHVFERFRQADGSTTRRHAGLGLGLSIVRQLVELHGGTVSAESDGPGLGATFTVTLPAAVPANGQAPEYGAAHGTGSARAAAAPGLAGVRVLVVEDDSDARLVVQHILRDAGAEVALASSADEALLALVTGRPDVLVSDIGMPDVDGYELMRRVRGLADPALAGLPALALSAFTRERDEVRAREAGFDSYVPKPMEAEGLVREIARLVEARSGGSQEPASAGSARQR